MAGRERRSRSEVHCRGGSWRERKGGPRRGCRGGCRGGKPEARRRRRRRRHVSDVPLLSRSYLFLNQRKMKQRIDMVEGEVEGKVEDEVEVEEV